jgi:Uma2 family endonuclease
MQHMAIQPTTFVTPEEYLAQERQADHKSEYFDGTIIAMVGTSRAHNLIVWNVLGILYNQMRGRPCEAYGNDMRVKVCVTGLYTYPDVAALCGEVRLEDAHQDTLLNPSTIIEVLSPSTEAYDRGAKFAHYRPLSSLREYILIAQDTPQVELYERQPDDRWLLTAVAGLETTVTVPSIDCTLKLAEIYEKVPGIGNAP